MKPYKIAALALLALSFAFGQANDGNISGTILDASGAAVPNASVSAQNLDTGVKATAKADSGGNYRLEHLLVGPYSITATATGFTTTYSDQVFFYVPGQGSDDQIRLLGYRSSLLEAKVSP